MGTLIVQLRADAERELKHTSSGNSKLPPGYEWRPWLRMESLLLSIWHVAISFALYTNRTLKKIRPVNTSVGSYTITRFAA